MNMLAVMTDKDLALMMDSAIVTGNKKAYRKFRQEQEKRFRKIFADHNLTRSDWQIYCRPRIWLWPGRIR